VGESTCVQKARWDARETRSCRRERINIGGRGGEKKKGYYHTTQPRGKNTRGKAKSRKKKQKNERIASLSTRTNAQEGAGGKKQAKR